MKRIISFVFIALSIAFFGLSQKAKADNISDESQMQTITAYQAIRNTKAYVKPNSKKVSQDFNALQKGDILFDEGCNSFTIYKKTWLKSEWRGLYAYYKLSDFKKVTYRGTQNIKASAVGNRMVFANSKGETVTIFRLDRNGYDVKGNSDDIYFIEFEGSDCCILEEKDGLLQLSGTNKYISRSEDDYNDYEGVVKNGKLTCDGYLQEVYDPDFMVDVYYIPSKQAIFSGELYYLKSVE